MDITGIMGITKIAVTMTRGEHYLMSVIFCVSTWLPARS
jgi:hypothetical protein